MNATMNGSIAICASLSNPTAEKTVKTMACCLIFIASLVGNSLIASIVYKTRALRKPINLFIVNMAVADLLFSIFWFPWKLTSLYENSWIISGPFGQALCKLYSFLSLVSMLVSVQSLVLIAVDRFGAVVFPLRSSLISSKLCPVFILATWIVAMAVSAPSIFTFTLVKYEAGQQTLWCSNQWNNSSSQANYVLLLCVVFVYIPIAFLAILYSIIVIKLKSQKIPGEPSVNADEQRARRNRNVIKMAVAIVLGFVLFWVPNTIIILLQFFAWNRFSYCEHARFVMSKGFSASLNCVFNPCICFIFSGNYRQGLKKTPEVFRVVVDTVSVHESYCKIPFVTSNSVSSTWHFQL